MNATIITRWILTALLIFGVYTETGPWTALFALLLAIGNEATQFQLNLINQRASVQNRFFSLLGLASVGKDDE